MALYKRLLQIVQKRGAVYFVLLDPDKTSFDELLSTAKTCDSQGVDGLLMGGSLLMSDQLDNLIESIQKEVSLPVILFPGDGSQLSRHADGILFLSLLSGRNPQFLIGEHVLAAPKIRLLGLEAIPTGYLLVNSGETSAVEFMSNTKPLPRDKTEIAVAHALAAEYLGMKLIYLEGGSGAKFSVPETMIRAVCDVVSIPVVVGGGIKTPDEAIAKVNAGASFVVTGNILEEEGRDQRIQGFVDAIHSSRVKGASV